MEAKLFEGVITPLFLPLDEQERIIEHDLVKHVEDQLKRGINGLLVPSGTGRRRQRTLQPVDARHDF